MAIAKATPLLDEHRALGAKLTRFAGWEMPLQYQGVIAEHTAVRSRVGIFDVSHLGKLLLSGAAAEDVVQRTVTADVSKLEPGRASYALVLNDDGGCIDDVFVYRLTARDWLVVPNAANVEAVADALRGSGGAPVDAWDRWAILALQGPASFEVADRLWPESGATDLKLHRFVVHDFEGREGLIARTGYTGEPGFELYVPSPASAKVWRSILDAGTSPVGLGARDTLRLEMGYALYGNELASDINPLEAGLGWVVAWDAPFRGRESLEKVREDGPRRKLFGVVCAGRGVPRHGYAVFAHDREIGTVTSGNHSPTLGTGIALALGPRSEAPAEGDRVEIEGRGRRIEGDIVGPPFVERGKKRPVS